MSSKIATGLYFRPSYSWNSNSDDISYCSATMQLQLYRLMGFIHFAPITYESKYSEYKQYV